MGPGDCVVFALVVDLSYACWVCVDPALAVSDHGVLSPRGFPELVGDLDVLFGEKIAVIVLV